MNKILSFIRKIVPTGLTAKLIRAVIIIFFIVGIEFFAVTFLHVRELEKTVRTEGEELTAQVEIDSREAMDNLTRQTLEELSVRSADKTDDELWVNAYELDILGSMVAEVFAHPENYNPVEVLPPDPKNGGELSLQLLAAEGYDNISPENMDMARRLANLAPIMASYIGSYTMDIYISLPDGTTLAMDKKSDQKYDENGVLTPYDARTRHWYVEAVKAKDLYFSPVMHSFFYDYDIVVYSLPVYVGDKLVAVLEGSLKTDKLQERVDYALFGDQGFNILVNERGQLVSTSRKEGELMMPADLEQDIRETVNPGLKALINTGLTGASGTKIVKVDDQEYYAGYGPLVTVGWTQISFVAVSEVMEPAELLVKETVDSSNRMQKRLKGAFSGTITALFLIMGFIVVATILIVSRFARKRVAPINHMTTKIQELSGEEMSFEMENIYRTGDEIETLASAFADQAGKLKTYMEDNIRISAEKERIDAEMSMATQIQDSMLPKVKPVFYDKPEYSLYARTVPAKDVGGDFYDFFYVDDNHLALVIADVSGKGVTAALFMALSKQMIQSQMMMNNGLTSDALSVTNVRLLEESIPDMFVTVWLGTVTLSTGHLVFVDAGHEYPAIQKGGGMFVIEKDNHSMAMAALKKAKFKTNEDYLKPGDTIYLYTDGVTEAHNEAGEMFGMERLAKALNEVVGLSPEEIDNHVRERIAEFVGEAEQFDDITTLCFRYLGQPAGEGDII